MEKLIANSLFKTVLKWKRKTETRMRAILSAKGKSHTRIYKQLKIIVTAKNGLLTIHDNLPSYATFVDKGRRPGKQPPLKSIKEWCKRRGIPESAAFPIAHNIGKRGIKATNFLNPMRKYQELIAELRTESVKFISKDIKETIKK